MVNDAESVFQSISDSKGHYDIDGVSLWHGRTIVGSGFFETYNAKNKIMDTKDKSERLRKEKQQQINRRTL